MFISNNQRFILNLQYTFTITQGYKPSSLFDEMSKNATTGNQRNSEFLRQRYYSRLPPTTHCKEKHLKVFSQKCSLRELTSVKQKSSVVKYAWKMLDSTRLGNVDLK